MFKKRFVFMFVLIVFPVVNTFNTIQDKKISISTFSSSSCDSISNKNVEVKKDTTVVDHLLKDKKSLISKKEKRLKKLLKWHKASASHYGDLSKVGNGKGIGSFGRKIESGSIAFGSDITKEFVKKGFDVFIEIKDFDIMTPYGKGIFRVDDMMGKEFSKTHKYFIDFCSLDLGSKHKYMGRFKVQFRIVKISKTANSSL